MHMGPYMCACGYAYTYICIHTCTVCTCSVLVHVCLCMWVCMYIICVISMHSQSHPCMPPTAAQGRITAPYRGGGGWLPGQEIWANMHPGGRLCREVACPTPPLTTMGHPRWGRACSTRGWRFVRCCRVACNPVLLWTCCFSPSTPTSLPQVGSGAVDKACCAFSTWWGLGGKGPSAGTWFCCGCLRILGAWGPQEVVYRGLERRQPTRHRPHCHGVFWVGGMERNTKIVMVVGIAMNHGFCFQSLPALVDQCNEDLGYEIIRESVHRTRWLGAVSPSPASAFSCRNGMELVVVVIVWNDIWNDILNDI